MGNAKLHAGNPLFLLRLSAILFLAALVINTLEMVLVYRFRIPWAVTEVVLVIITTLSVYGYLKAEKMQSAERKKAESKKKESLQEP